MPLHEYQCDVCGLRFEKIHKFSDPPLETCPKCSGHVHKLISAPAFQFKGSGWYITDYAKKDTTASSKSDGSPSSEGSSSKPEGSSQDKESTPAKADPSPVTSDKSSPSSTPSPKASTKASAKDQKD